MELHLHNKGKILLLLGLPIDLGIWIRLLEEDCKKEFISLYQQKLEEDKCLKSI
jgi:hypothetical protein